MKKLQKIKDVDNSENNLNYFMLDKNFKKGFYKEGESIICEAKGRIGQNCLLSDSNELKYFITTYKGQSGSPIFLRKKNKKSSFIKNLTHPKYNSQTQDEYDYFFIGIHSRSPEEVIKKEEESFFFNRNSLEKSSLADASTAFNASGSSSGSSNSSLNLKSSKLTSNSDIDFITKTNFANYNIGLKITKKIVDSVKELLFKKKENLNYNLNSINEIPIQSTESLYYPVSLFISGERILRGVFSKFAKMEALFKVAEKLSEINKTFLGFYFLNEIINYDEKNIKISIEDLLNCLKTEDRKEISLEIEVDFESLGKNIGEKLVSKIKETEDDDLYKNKERNIILIKYVFESISFLQGKFMNIYGMTFDAIKSYVFSAFNFDN